jgi:hypothetical protein
MASAQLLARLAMVGCLEALSALPLAPAPPPVSPLPPTKKAAEAPAAATPGEGDVARSVGRLDERLRARIEECERREFDTKWGEGKKLVAAPIRKIESELVNLLKRHPGDGRVKGELAKLYGDWCVAPEPPSPAVVELLAGASDPAGLALELTRGESATTSATELLLAALALRPDSAALWMQAANGVERTDWKIALTAQAVRSLGEGDGPRDAARTRLAAAVAEEELELEITWGLLARATSRLALLPEEVRTIVESGASGKAEAVVGGVCIEGRLRDLRLDLALLRLTRGDADGAAPLLAAGKPQAPAAAAASGGDYDLPPGSWSPYSRPRFISGSEDTKEAARLRWTWFQLLESWRQPSPVDPFELLLASLRATSASYGHRIAAAELARRERYPAVAAHLEETAADDLRSELARGVFHRESGPAPPPPPAPAAAEVEKLYSELAALAGRMEESAREDREEARAALGPDPAAAAVARLLRAPLLKAFVEHPLPRGVVPLGEEEMDRRQKRALRELKLPAGFEVLRAERRGQRAAALGQSLDYGSPALWVILSSDRGATWSRSLYTGLVLHSRSMVHRASNLPLIAGDRLQIEVELEVPAPAASPSNPHPQPAVEHRYFEIPIATLQRDSDGDGLTDLAEEQLLTDPLEPDTDHDGIPDGEDPLPQVVEMAGGSAASCAAAALVEQVFGIAGERQEGGKHPEVPGRGRHGSLDGETHFLAADRQLFTALRPRERVVVLTPEEMAQAEEKLWAYRHHRLDLFMLDRAGHRAFVLWSWWAEWQNWMGGIVRLEEIDGRWRVKESQEWTT